MNKLSTLTPTWDIAIRLFHWTLVASFVTAYLTGEHESLLHINSGYLILGLLCFRFVWGLIGSKHARFVDFIYKPSQIIRYAKNMMSGKAEHIQGHNPLGGLMVFALLICLTVTTITGLKVYGLEGYGPLAGDSSFVIIKQANASSPNGYERYEGHESAEHFWEEIHEFFANFTVFLILFHIAGVILSSRIEKQNLVKAMITGYKQNTQ